MLNMSMDVEQLRLTGAKEKSIMLDLFIKNGRVVDGSGAARTCLKHLLWAPEPY